MLKEENSIRIIDRIKELVIDWIVICIYLIILAIISSYKKIHIDNDITIILYDSI